MLCKVCNEREAHPKYSGLCSQCRTQRYEYSKGKTCSECGKPVTNRKTRCLNCAQKSRRNRVERTCQECGQTYITKVSERLKYCSQACRVAAWSREVAKGGEHAISWKGTETVYADGYVSAFHPERKKRVAVHVQMAEKVLGRRLKPGEVVHHINLDKTDNRPSNLLICTQSYHQWLHYQMTRAWVNEHLRQGC